VQRSTVTSGGFVFADRTPKEFGVRPPGQFGVGQPVSHGLG
jgi:hypothetical protein